VKLKSIQALRAVAALLVAYSHSIDTQMRFSVSRQQGFYFLQDFGAIGVDLFFVISGFIITLVARDALGTMQGVRFLAKRFIRVNPIYYAASALYKAVTVLAMMPFLPANLPFDPYTVGLQRSLTDTLLILPTTARPLSYAPLIVVGWTLAFEWIFYALFFLLIVGRTAHKALGLFVQIVVLVLVGRAFAITDQRLVYLTNPILLEFLFGVGICWVYLHGPRVPPWLATAFLLGGLAGYAYSIRYGFGEVSELLPVLTGRVGLKRVLWWGAPSALLAAGCVFLETAGALRRLWDNALLQRIGDASYSIYLVHLTVFAVCTLAYRTWGFFLPADLAVFVQLALAVAVSLAFYRYVEQPLLRGLHGWWGV
jgi:exopolysaccharide production protein ExoZ